MKHNPVTIFIVFARSGTKGTINAVINTTVAARAAPRDKVEFNSSLVDAPKAISIPPPQKVQWLGC